MEKDLHGIESVIGHKSTTSYQTQNLYHRNVQWTGDCNLADLKDGKSATIMPLQATTINITTTRQYYEPEFNWQPTQMKNHAVHG